MTCGEQNPGQRPGFSLPRLSAVRQQQLEGVVGKRKDSLYEAGKRTGSWVKYRVNRGQELVIGGYIPGPHGFDSLIVGYYRGEDLIYVARVRNGFVPASRRQVFEKIRYLTSLTMPFVNLPDTHKSRWGDELTAEKMKECDIVAASRGCCSNRILGVDGSRSAETLKVCWIARRQRPATGCKGTLNRNQIKRL
jgi:hypothetical protein